MQQVQSRCWGRMKGEGTYSSTSLASMNSSESLLLSLSSKTASASKTTVTVVLVAVLIFSYMALAFAVFAAVTFLQSSNVGQGLVQLQPTCPA